MNTGNRRNIRKFYRTRYEGEGEKMKFITIVIVLLCVLGANFDLFAQDGFGISWSYGFLAAGDYSGRAVNFSGKFALSPSLKMKLGAVFGRAPIVPRTEGEVYNFSGSEIGLFKYFGMRRAISPFLFSSLGASWFDNGQKGLGWFGSAGIGAGLRYRLSESVAVNLNGSYNLWLKQNSDVFKSEMDEPFSKLSIGLNYYFPFTHTTIADAIDTPLYNMPELAEDSQYDFVVRMVSYEEKESEFQRLKNLKKDDLSPEIEKQIEDLKMAIIDRNRSLAMLRVEADETSQRIHELESKLSLKKDKAQPATKSTVKVVQKPVISPPEYFNRYMEAHGLFEVRQYEDAIVKFKALLQSDPQNILAGNCQYWIGECYYGLKDYKTAINAMLDALSYEKSTKRDDALLMLGQAHYRIGHKAKAKTFFQQLLDQYPKSEYRRTARSYIKRLDS